MSDALLALLPAEPGHIGRAGVGLVLLIPLLIALAGALGSRLGRPQSRRLAVWGLALSLWLMLPLQPATAAGQQIGAMISALGWGGLVLTWAHGLFRNGLQPLWAQVLVITALLALAVLVLWGLVAAPART